jgi:hypothetical protein
MAEHNLEYEQKELNKALNLAIIGLVGAIIPILGLIMGFIALATALSVGSTHAKVRAKKTTVLVVASFAIGLSLLAGVGYYAYYHQTQVDNRKQAEQTQKAAEQAAQQKSDQAAAVKASLNLCLSQADDAYTQYLQLNSTRTTTDASGQKIYYLQQTQWDYVNGKRTTDKDECYRKSAAGVTGSNNLFNQ